MALRNGHHHAVAVDIRHSGGEAEEFRLLFAVALCLSGTLAVCHTEEDYGLAILEVMFNALVGGAVDLQGKLVE